MNVQYIWLVLAPLFLFGSGAIHAAQPNLPRLHQYSDRISSSGQPTRSQFSEIELAGYALVVNLAPPNFPGALTDERQLVESARMSYVHIPVDWDKPSLQDFAKFVDVMEQNKDRKVLVHCWVNSRASGFVYLYRTLLEAQPEQAEFEVMSRLWNLNRGYELANAPQWRAYFDQARGQFKR